MGERQTKTIKKIFTGTNIYTYCEIFPPLLLPFNATQMRPKCDPSTFVLTQFFATFATLTIAQKRHPAPPPRFKHPLPHPTITGRDTPSQFRTTHPLPQLTQRTQQNVVKLLGGLFTRHVTPTIHCVQRCSWQRLGHHVARSTKHFVVLPNQHGRRLSDGL